ncbi:MAG: flippase [Clostridia bacterium]|nr:flippase [Clostridia bacterium]
MESEINKINGEKRSSFLLNNTIIFAVSIFGTKILSFFLLPLYTNVLTTTQYGQIDLTTTINSLLPFFLTLCISDAVLRFVMEKKEDQKKILTYAMKIIGIGTLILTIGLGVCFVTNIINSSNKYYLFLVLLFPLDAFRTLFSSFLKGIEKTKDILIESLISTFLTLTLTIITVVVLKWGVFGYLGSSVLGLVFGCLYYYLRIRKETGKLIEPGIAAELKRQMILYSLPLILNGLSWWINASSDKFIINMFWGESENGIYSVAGKVASILTMVTNIFAQAWTLSSIKSCQDDDYGDFFSNIYNSYNALLLIGASFLILINQPLSKFLFAKDFFIANESSSILVVSIIFNSLASFLSGAFSAFKNNRVLAISTIISAVINIGLNFLLIPKLGCVGAATATVISFIVLWLLRLYFAKKYIKIKSNFILNIFSYILILIQLVCDHLAGRYYFVQGIIFVLLFVINFKYIMKIAQIILCKLVSLFRRNKNEEV